MNAGRELDALVAEKVMGMRRYGATRYGKPCVVLVRNFQECWNYTRTQNDPGTWTETTDAITEWRGIAAYSTDIAAAWTVVEKLRDTTDGDETWVSVMDYGARGWCCEIVYNLCSGKDAPVVLGEIVADTAPLAICLAALDSVATEAQA